MPAKLIKSAIDSLTGSASSSVPGIELAPSNQALNYISVNSAFKPYVGKIPASALSVPSMMSAAEKRVLFGLAETYYAGEGVIVDAGIFLGASTRCFGEGVRANAQLRKAVALKKKPIISFEKGDVNPGMPAFFRRHRMDVDVPVGGSFIQILRQNIAPVADLVELRVGDILKDSEDLSQPIEICFLDILKLPDISLHCIRRFFPRLIPGRSIVVQQDYFYEKLPYIKVHQEFLGDHFEYIGEIGSTALFRCISKIPEAKLAAMSSISAEEQLRLSAIATQRSNDPARRFLMSLSKARLVHKLAGKDEAKRYLETIFSDFPTQIEDLAHNRIIDAIREIRVLCGMAEE